MQGNILRFLTGLTAKNCPYRFRKQFHKEKNIKMTKNLFHPESDNNIHVTNKYSYEGERKNEEKSI